MSIQSEVANMHALMLSKGVAPETADAIALALYRELVPGCSLSVAREGVAKALTTAKTGPGYFRQAAPRPTALDVPEEPAPAERLPSLTA